MLTIICQKQLNKKEGYTLQDVEILNDSIKEGIEELKGDWRNPESDGITIIETEKELRFELDKNKIDFDMYSSFENIKRSIMLVINNYAIPYIEKG